MEKDGIHPWTKYGARMGLRALALSLGIGAIGPDAASAQEDRAPDREEMAERLRQGLDSLAVKLELSGEQRPAFDSIMAASMRERAEILRDMKGVRDGGGSRRSKFRKLRSLRGELDEEWNETRSRLSEVLTEDQLETLEELMAERRAKMREEMQRRREGGGGR